MIDFKLKEELNDKLGYVIRTFGSVEDYLNVLTTRVTNEEELELNVHRLLAHPGTVSIISPWNCYIRLFDDNLLSYSTDSIVFNQPYNVFDFRGRLLYSVTEHNGVFGNSILDKTLLLQSVNTEIYYLQYATYLGTSETRLLLVNNKSLVTASVGVNEAYVKVPVISNVEETAVNQIIFSSNSSIALYYIPGAPVRIPSKESIISNPYAITHKGEKQLVFNVTKSGWIVCKSNNKYLKVNNIVGAGVDRLLSVNEEDIIYYVIVGDEADVTTLKQTLQVRGLGLESTPISNVINLSVNLE